MSPLRLFEAIAKRLAQLARPSLAGTEAEAATRRTDERYRRIVWTTVTSFSYKIVNILTMVVSIPLAVRYLGPERFGLWMTIVSVTALMTFADLGIGNGLLNAISRAYGRDRPVAAQVAVSSAFFLLFGLGVGVFLLLAAAGPFVPWRQLFHLSTDITDSEVNSAVAAFVACFAVALPVSTVQRVQLGYQEGFVTNLWQIVGSLAGLAGLILVIRFNGGLPWLILAMTGGPIFATALNFATHFAGRRRWLAPQFRHFHLGTGQEFIRTGATFAFLQLLAFLGFASDSLMISYFWGAAAVAPYAVVSKLYSALFLVQYISGPLWPAFGEALARDDHQWARITFRRSLVLCSGLGLLGGVVLVAGGKPLISVWTGDATVPNWGMLLGFALWLVVASYYAPIAALLSNTSLLRYQVRIYSMAALSSFALKVPFVMYFGPPGAIWAAVLGYGGFALYARRIASEAL